MSHAGRWRLRAVAPGELGECVNWAVQVDGVTASASSFSTVQSVHGGAKSTSTCSVCGAIDPKQIRTVSTLVCLFGKDVRFSGSTVREVLLCAVLQAVLARTRDGQVDGWASPPCSQCTSFDVLLAPSVREFFLDGGVPQMDQQLAAMYEGDAIPPSLQRQEHNLLAEPLGHGEQLPQLQTCPW